MAGVVFFTNPIDVSVGSSGSFVDIDNANVPSGAEGVILRIINTDASNARTIDFRKKGGTGFGNWTTQTATHHEVMVGVDADGVFQVSVQDHVTAKVYIVGYWEDGSAVFFDGPVTKSLSLADGSWEDVDISANVAGGDVAQGAIFVVQCGTSRIVGARKNGSSDTRTFNVNGGHYAVITAVDGNGVAEFSRNSTQVSLFQIGYIKAGAEIVWVDPSEDYSLGSTGSYADLTALPAGATGGAFLVQAGANQVAIRENGSTSDIYYKASNGGFFYVGADDDGVVEGKISDAAVDFYLTAWFGVENSFVPKIITVLNG